MKFCATSLVLRVIVCGHADIPMATRAMYGKPGGGGTFTASVQNSPGAYPAFCKIGNGLFPGDKAAEASR